MVSLMRDAMVPLNADCATWTMDCDWWRITTSVCPVTAYAFFINAYSAGGIGISGGWLSATEGPYCAGTDPYITQAIASANSYYIYIDVWKACADGLWTSSVTFNILAEGYPGGANVISAFGATLASPAGTGLLPSVAVPAGTFHNCPTNVFRTLTIYDDGTYTYT